MGDTTDESSAAKDWGDSERLSLQRLFGGKEHEDCNLHSRNNILNVAVSRLQCLAPAIIYDKDAPEQLPLNHLEYIETASTYEQLANSCNCKSGARKLKRTSLL